MDFKFLEHTADIKFQAFGTSIEKAFENSALAMFNAMSNKRINARIKEEFIIDGTDLENLLYNFLEELLFLLDSKNFFVSKIKLKIIGNKKKSLVLKAKLFGDDAKKYETKMDVKAVTYNEMFIKKIGKNWVCQVVLDV